MQFFKRVALGIPPCIGVRRAAANGSNFDASPRTHPTTHPPMNLPDDDLSTEGRVHPATLMGTVIVVPDVVLYYLIGVGP